MDIYYVIMNNDGMTTVEPLPKQILTKRLNERYYGKVEIMTVPPDNNDTNYWENKILVIKGSIAKISPVEVITEYEIQ